ncbi:MAG TPA: sigma-70 family RNA polymerase sigma factor [Ktedonobacterales bacterium]|nr:sigma-70 family RNA polymerase sigma factor [Ktedonobacterales bacterium]
MQHPFPAFSASSPGGDDTPIARLYQEHAPAVLAWLRLRAPTQEDAEDLLLEVFEAALAQAVMLQTRDGPAQRAWLRRVAANKLADYYRRRGGRQPLLLEQVAEALYADEAQSPEQTALTREEHARLHLLLRDLPRLQQQVMYLRFVYGLRSAEIAATLGKREGAVRKLLWRTLNLVRARYLDQ